jgi:hypothetical protein
MKLEAAGVDTFILLCAALNAADATSAPSSSSSSAVLYPPTSEREHDESLSESRFERVSMPRDVTRGDCGRLAMLPTRCVSHSSTERCCSVVATNLASTAARAFSSSKTLRNSQPVTHMEPTAASADRALSITIHRGVHSEEDVSSAPACLETSYAA